MPQTVNVYRPKFSNRNRLKSALCLFSSILMISPNLVFANTCPVIPESANKQTSATKLVVQITLDQLRAEIPQRMKPMFTGGLKRMLEDGLVFSKGYVDHGQTVSHPGHGTIATGAHPSSHGLVTNDIWLFSEEKGWHWEEMVADNNEHIVPFTDRPGASPKALDVPTLGTWMKWHNSKAKAITISNSAFAAVTQAGWVSDGAYWLDGKSGSMVTSSYYTSKLPDWVNRFNQGPLLDAQKNHAWNLSVPKKYRHLARKDEASFEKTFNTGGDVFPHKVDFSALQQPDNTSTETQIVAGWFRGVPRSDELILQFAQQAVESHCLGQGVAIDYLNIGLGVTDVVGHDYGPRSLEQLDVFYRIDLALGKFYDFLDKAVGKGAYVVALTGDHGAPDVLEYRQQKGLFAERVKREEIDALFLQLKSIAEKHKGTHEELIPLIEAHIETKNYVADALTEAELSGTKSSSFKYLDLMRRSFRPGIYPEFPIWGTGEVSRDHHPGRYGIWVVFKPYTHFDYAASVHGSPYDYDRQVPILFYGGGIKSKESDYPARTVDIAPTLSKLAGIPYPDSVDGKAIDLSQKF